MNKDIEIVNSMRCIVKLVRAQGDSPTKMGNKMDADRRENKFLS